jgi:hypothetical protein
MNLKRTKSCPEGAMSSKAEEYIRNRTESGLDIVATEASLLGRAIDPDTGKPFLVGYFFLPEKYHTAAALMFENLEQATKFAHLILNVAQETFSEEQPPCSNGSTAPAVE